MPLNERATGRFEALAPVPAQASSFEAELAKIEANPTDSAAYTRKHLKKTKLPVAQFLTNLGRMGISLTQEDVETADNEHDKNLAVAVAKVQNSLGNLNLDGKFGPLTFAALDAHMAAKEVAAVNAQLQLEELKGPISGEKEASPEVVSNPGTIVLKNTLSSPLRASQVAIVGDSIMDQIAPHIKGVPDNQVDAVVSRRMLKSAAKKPKGVEHGNILDAAEAMLAKLKPGDLLCWDGAINDADQVKSESGVATVSGRLIAAHLSLIEKAHALGIKTAVLLPHPPLAGHKDATQQERIEKVMSLVGDALKKSDADVIIDPTPLLSNQGISTRDRVHLNTKGVKAVSAAINGALFG